MVDVRLKRTRNRSCSALPVRAWRGQDVRVARRHRLAKSHTLHPHDLALAWPFEGPPRERAAGWVTIPFSAIQFSGSAACRVGLPRGLSGRWGWVSSPPRGPCQAEGRSACERHRTTFWVEPRMGGGRYPWLGDRGVLRCRGLRRPSRTDSLSPTSSVPEGRCPSRDADSTDPWAGSKTFSLEISISLQVREFGAPEGVTAGGAGAGGQLAPGPPRWGRGLEAPGGMICGTVIAPRGTAFGGSRGLSTVIVERVRET